MKDDPYHIINYPLLGLKALGRHPKMNPILDKIAATFYLITLAYLSVVTFLQYSNIKGDIYKYANNFEGTTAYIQMSGKVIFTLTHKNKINELLDDMKLFWSIKACDEPMRRKLETVLERSANVLKFFLVCITATEILIVMAPIFTKDIAVGSWTMEGHDVLFKLTLVVQEGILFFIFTTFTFMIDCLFLVLFIYVIIQYKILNYCFRSLSISNDLNMGERKHYTKSLRRCIQYHKFLLSYSKKLQETASPIMLIEYTTTAILFCTEMYMFIESNSLQESIRRPVSFCAVLFQLGFYCIPADYVTGESLSVADAIYESDWISEYESSSRKMIPFIIQRPQRPIVFSAGGLVNMNARTLINVVKISWSVCTVLRAAKNYY